METINNIELNNPNIYPTDDILMPILAKSFSIYKKLIALFKLYGMNIEWRYYKDGKAWLCKVQTRGRTIVWMSAFKGFMQATIYFPEKFISGIYTLNISKTTINSIFNRKNIGKSKPCIFEVKDNFLLNDFEEIMKYKIQSG